MLPNFVVVGAQKSASTFVDECLKEHPAIFMPRYETPFFEDPDYDRGAIADVEALFTPVTHETAFGIKRPDYLGRAECPPRLARHLPAAKLIAVLREPVSRAVSACHWYMQVGILPVRPLNATLHDLLHGDLSARYPKAREIVDYGFYHQHLARYRRTFPPEQMLILLHDELLAAPHAAIRRVYQFLGVDDSYMPQALHRHPKATVYAPSRLRWLAQANRRFFYDYVPYGEQQTALLPKTNRGLRLAYYAMVATDRVLLERLIDNEKPSLDPALAHDLARVYAEDVDALEACLGRSLAAWKAAA